MLGKMAELVIQNGGNVNVPGTGGITPLMVAAENGKKLSCSSLDNLMRCLKHFPIFYCRKMWNHIFSSMYYGHLLLWRAITAMKHSIRKIETFVSSITKSKSFFQSLFSTNALFGLDKFPFVNDYENLVTHLPFLHPFIHRIW